MLSFIACKADNINLNNKKKQDILSLSGYVTVVIDATTPVDKTKAITIKEFAASGGSLTAYAVLITKKDGICSDCYCCKYNK